MTIKEYAVQLCAEINLGEISPAGEWAAPAFERAAQRGDLERLEVLLAYDRLPPSWQRGAWRYHAAAHAVSAALGKSKLQLWADCPNCRLLTYVNENGWTKQPFPNCGKNDAEGKCYGEGRILLTEAESLRLVSSMPSTEVADQGGQNEMGI